MPASDIGATYTGGRRPKAAKAGNRGVWGTDGATPALTSFISLSARVLSLRHFSSWFSLSLGAWVPKNLAGI
jgi:hypothetical protein